MRIGADASWPDWSYFDLLHGGAIVGPGSLPLRLSHGIGRDRAICLKGMQMSRSRGVATIQPNR